MLALTLLAGTVVSSALGRFGSGLGLAAVSGASFGWKLYLVAAGFGLVAYAAVDGEAGPAYIGVAVLLAFAVMVGLNLAGRGSLVGWPLFLLVIGGAGLVIGLGRAATSRRRPGAPPSPQLCG